MDSTLYGDITGVIHQAGKIVKQLKGEYAMPEITKCQYCNKPRPQTVKSCPYCKPTTAQLIKHSTGTAAGKLSAAADIVADAAINYSESARNSKIRTCMVCQRTSEMKTWLGNYNAPQLVMVLLAFCFLVPAVIFAAMYSGKYKCPCCGTVGKNIMQTS